MPESTHDEPTDDEPTDDEPRDDESGSGQDDIDYDPSEDPDTEGTAAGEEA